MGGRRQRKTNEMRPLFPKGRPRSGSQMTLSNFSPIFEGSLSPRSPHSSRSHLLSRDDLLSGSGSLHVGKSRENISKSRESLSKSIRGSREDIIQSPMTEPQSSNLSKITFLNMATNKSVIAWDEPRDVRPRRFESTSQSQGDLILDLEIPALDVLHSQNSSSSSGNHLKYATPPFMESSSGSDPQNLNKSNKSPRSSPKTHLSNFGMTEDCYVSGAPLSFVSPRGLSTTSTKNHSIHLRPSLMGRPMYSGPQMVRSTHREKRPSSFVSSSLPN